MEFAVAAAEGGMMEVRLGQLAATNATSPKVKELGRMMVADHTRANDELKSLAAKKNITLPADLSNDKQKAYEELAAKKGKDFDEAYAEFMVADHKEDIELFQHQADDGKDADLKAWAAGKVSVLKHHLQMAQTTKDAVD
jgi:putative membrane protein